MARTLSMIALSVLIASQTVIFSQTKPTAATYITDEEVKAVNATPGVDRTIRVVDIGNEHFAVGIIHRVAAGGAAARGAGAGTGGGAAAGTGRAPASAPTPCGEPASTLLPGATPGESHTIRKRRLRHRIGQRDPGDRRPYRQRQQIRLDGAVTRELNGPSCSGLIAGLDVVKRAVKTGDIIIIPAASARTGTDITDHVDYL